MWQYVKNNKQKYDIKGGTESLTAVLIWKLTELFVDAIAALLLADARLLVRKTYVIREGKR